jgi:hypothetical protein
VNDLVSIDFFTVPTAHLHVLFVPVVLGHHRRRVLHFNVTERPTAAWTTQQILDAFPEDSAPEAILREVLLADSRDRVGLGLPSGGIEQTQSNVMSSTTSPTLTAPYAEPRLALPERKPRQWMEASGTSGSDQEVKCKEVVLWQRCSDVVT